MRTGNTVLKSLRRIFHSKAGSCHSERSTWSRQREERLLRPPSLLLLAQFSKENVAAAVRSLDPAYADYAKKVIEQGIDGLCIVELLESPNADEFNLFLVQLGVPLVAHQKRLKRLFSDMHTRAAAAVAAAAAADAAPAAAAAARIQNSGTPATASASVKVWTAQSHCRHELDGNKHPFMFVLQADGAHFIPAVASVLAPASAQARIASCAVVLLLCRLA